MPISQALITSHDATQRNKTVLWSRVLSVTFNWGVSVSDVSRCIFQTLVLAYLDDITLGDDAETVLGDFLQPEESALCVGLEINRQV